jgi:DNA-directed RNA polymerase specialized sigma24 family protein
VYGGRRGRLDASDVLQEAFLDVRRKAAEFAVKGMSAYLWLRLIVAERLLILHRHHLGARKSAFPPSRPGVRPLREYQGCE